MKLDHYFSHFFVSSSYSSGMFSARNTYFSKKNLDISQHFVIFATEKYVLMTKYLLKISFLALMLLGTPVMLNAVPSIEISENDMNTVEISFDGSDLYVNNANGLVLSIYNVTGVRVMQTKIEGPAKRISLNLPKGCYIVKVGNVARKISVK